MECVKTNAAVINFNQEEINKIIRAAFQEAVETKVNNAKFAIMLEFHKLENASYDAKLYDVRWLSADCCAIEKEEYHY